jgi:hypothetical protein
MYTYNSFLSSKNSKLNENQLKTDQEEAVEQAIERGKIVLGGKNNQDRRNGWRWYGFSQGIHFNVDVKVKYNAVEKSLTELGFTFGNVSGDFDCHGSSIESLEGSPKICHDFNASESDLKSLKGSPSIVTNFDAQNCLITSLEGSPKFVFGDFNLTNNVITDLSGGPLIISGSIGLLGNGFFGAMQKDPSAYNTVKLFHEMHKFIVKEYMNVNLSVTKENIEKDLANNEYFPKIISENPDYIQFIKGYDNVDLAKGILKINPTPNFLSTIKKNLPLVWKEIINIKGRDSNGYETSADLGELGF